MPIRAGHKRLPGSQEDDGLHGLACPDAQHGRQQFAAHDREVRVGRRVIEDDNSDLTLVLDANPWRSALRR
jgi:hypothetical protein